MPQGKKAVPGSVRTVLRNAKPFGKVDPKERIEVTVRLRSRSSDADWRAYVMQMGSKHPSKRTYLSLGELATRRGVNPEDLAKVDAFAHAHHLSVIEASIPKRIVRLAGTVADHSRAFGVQLRMYKSKEVIHRGRTGPVYVPGELARVVEGVFGLDNRPYARAHSRRSSAPQARNSGTIAHTTAGKSKTQKGTQSHSARIALHRLSVPEVAKLYNFPSHLRGAGQCIALIELNSIDQHGKIAGTGYDIRDLEAYFKKLGRPMPKVSAIGVDGGANTPGSYPIGDAEVTVDIDVAGTIAPQAKIAVYFAPDTDAGFLDVVNAALHDALRKPSVISISWGGPEENSTKQFLKALDDVIQDAAALGVTVCCETGDFGSSDQPAQSRDGQPHVEFPASSPFALACGGTRLASGGRAITSEVAWNDGDNGGAGGGGVSNIFPRPKYQATTKIPNSPKGHKGRGLPDVAGNAIGYQMMVGGKPFPVSGTSAVAPLWAGLIALINQELTAHGGKTAGFLNPLIYDSLSKNDIFSDIIDGNNDIDGKLKKYSAGPGWDSCTGWGTPSGAKLLQALQRPTAAKNPASGKRK